MIKVLFIILILLTPVTTLHLEPISYVPIEKENVMIEKNQLRNLIERVLDEIGLYSEEAVELLMLTCAVESKLGTYIRQVRGPARGIFQIEPNTNKDMWENYLKFKPELVEKIKMVSGKDESCLLSLEGNIIYGICMARVYYLRVPTPLPNINMISAMAQYWKKHYNTYLGAGTIDKAIYAYESYAV